MIRIVRTLWITRKSIDDGFHPAELIAAWDEFSTEENPEGWSQECERALSAVGTDLASHRYVNLRVSDRALNEAFWPVEIEAAISASESEPKSRSESR